MKNYTYGKTTITKLNINGVLSDDGKTIEYVGQDKEPATMDIGECLEPFLGEEITLTIGTKVDEDLTEEV